MKPLILIIICISFSLGLGIENIFSQVISDTLYSEPALDGELAYFHKYNQVVINAGEGSMLPGDGISAVGYGNISSRGFLSFSLTDLKNNISIDSAKLVVYQMGSFGNSKYNLFPIWDVPRGDTLYCIVDHIDFGESLDTLDWYLDSLNLMYRKKSYNTSREKSFSRELRNSI